MKPIRLLLYALLVIGLTVGVISAVYTFTRPELPPGSQSIEYLYTVAEYPGIDAATDIFRLGAVTPKSTSRRSLSITDPYQVIADGRETQPKTVKILAVGEGSEWLTIEPATLIVPGVVNVSVSIPEDAPKGVYKGHLLVLPQP